MSVNKDYNNDGDDDDDNNDGPVELVWLVLMYVTLV